MNNIIQTIRHTARAATVLLLALLAAQTAGANDAVTYIDENGVTQTITEYTEVTTDMTADGNGRINWSSGTYVVKSSVTLNGCIRYSGEVIDLIVCDGATLTVNGTSNGAFDGKTLNIYAQSNGTDMGVVNAKKQTKCSHLNIAGGKVTLDDDGAGYGLYVFDGDARGLTVNGGDVTIQNSSGSQGAIRFAGRGFVTLNGGKLTVTNSMGNGYTAIEGNSDSNTINFNGGTAVINGKIIDFNNINLNSGNVTVNGEIYKREGYTVTYDFTRATDSYYIKAFSKNLSSYATRTVQVKDGVSFRCNGNSYSGTLTDDQIAAISGQTMTPDISNHFSVNDAGTDYTIHTAKGWGLFCDRLAADDGKTFFTGKKVKLAADITVSRMAGSDHHDFCGTFDGGGHTLTFNYNTDTDDAAPFRYVESGCVIENLRVCGTIETSAKYAAGLVAHQYGNVTIRNCRSSVTIKSSFSSGNGDGTHGGFVAENCKDGDITFEGCLFDGKLLTTGSTATTRCGGFVGWRSNNTEAVIKVKNSLYAPASPTGSETWISTTESATFVRNGIASDITNSYYTSDFNDGSSFTGQGKQLRTIAAGEGVTIGHDGVATEYNVSGITAYKASGASGDSDPFIAGLLYNNNVVDVLYAGSDDAVSLTLSNTAPDGYSFDGYTASAGTLSGSANPYTLTMPDEDVTVSLALAVLPWTGDGTEDSPYIIYNKDQLDLLAHRVNGTHGETATNYEGKYFKLANDISYPHKADGEEGAATESNYEAIGGTRSFRGHFDGNNKTISGIRIYKGGTGDANSYLGIFGATSYGAYIHDLTLADARITGFQYTGGIVGYNRGTVTRCHVADDVAVCAVQNNGGIVGYNFSGTIEQCTSAVTLTTYGAVSRWYYGGIAGRNESGTLRDNLAIGATVPAAADNDYGAITGYNSTDGTLQRNYYAACKVADEENATGVGCNTADVNNEDNPDGAVCINTLALAANLAPDGNFWTTYYNGFLGFTIDADENACAYTATYGAGQLTLHNQGKEIPAGTAVIIVADNDEVSMTATDLPVTVGDNDLRGVDVDTPVADIRSDLGEGTFYVLGMTTVNNEQHFGFHRYTGTTMAAHKAFVLVSGSQQAEARSLTMVFDEASGISDATRLNNKEQIKNNNWFTLDGRRLQAKPTAPGIYVNNGNKVVIK